MNNPYFVGLKNIKPKIKETKMYQCTIPGCKYLSKRKRLYCPAHSDEMKDYNKKNYDRRVNYGA